MKFVYESGVARL